MTGQFDPKTVAALRAVAAATLLFALGGPAMAQVLQPNQLITRADMTAQERTFYDGLSGDAVGARNFIITRSFVRLCEQVVEMKLPAKNLPDKPAGFSVKYLLPREPNVINRALGYSAAAAMGSTPQARDMTPAQIISPADFTPDEGAFYKTLTNPEDSKAFIETRSYVRLCQRVADHTLDPEKLPDRPLDYDGAFVKAAEKTMVDDAEKTSLASLMSAHLK